MKQANAPPAEAIAGYIRQRELLKLLGVSRVTLWTWRRDGAFPPGVRLGPNVVAWRRDVVQDWLSTRPAA